MTLVWNIARVGAVLVALLAMVLLLPDAPAELEELVIPDVIFDPLTAFLQLDRYFPISTLLSIASVAIAIRVGMVGLWIYSWIAKHVFGAS